MDHKDDDYERVMHEIVRMLQQGRVPWLHSKATDVMTTGMFQDLMQLCNSCVMSCSSSSNCLKWLWTLTLNNYDNNYDKLFSPQDKNVRANGACTLRHSNRFLVFRFVIGHERPIALILFILSILLGFPIGAILGIVLIILQLILLGLLHCLGWTSGGVERGMLIKHLMSAHILTLFPR